MVPCYWHQAGVNDDFSSGHGPCVGFWTLNEIEFPLVSRQVGCQAVFGIVLLDGGFYAIADGFDHLGLCGIGTDPVFGDELAVTLIAHRVHHGIGDEV